jgi:hypothetical protein
LDLELERVASVEVDDLVVQAGLGHFGLEVGEWGEEDVVVADVQ